MIELPIALVFAIIAAVIFFAAATWFYSEQVRHLQGYIHRLERHIDGEIISKFERR